MRLSEFTDPKYYLPTEARTAKVLRQKQIVRPTTIGDDDAPTQPRPKKRPSNDRAKISDAR